MDSFSMVKAKGSYQFKINHMQTKDMPMGKKITSPKFRVGPQEWTILYYPQYFFEDNNGKYASVYLEWQGKSTDVIATFEFALLKKDGNISSTSSGDVSDKLSSGERNWFLICFIPRTKLEEMCFQDDTFVLHISITINDKSCKGPERSNTSSIMHIKTFRDKNKHTDVTFDVDGKKFAAHRLILAAHSPVFEAELFGSMAESQLECIPIKEVVPSVFKAMLDFMYNDSLPVTEKLIDGEELISSVSFLENLLAAANRYAVEQLKTICEKRLQKSISMDTVLSLLESAERHNCNKLKKDCLKFIADKENSFPLMVTEGYFYLMQNYPSLLVELRAMASE